MKKVAFENSRILTTLILLINILSSAFLEWRWCYNVEQKKFENSKTMAQFAKILKVKERFVLQILKSSVLFSSIDP